MSTLSIILMFIGGATNIMWFFHCKDLTEEKNKLTDELFSANVALLQYTQTDNKPRFREQKTSKVLVKKRSQRHCNCGFDEILVFR
jgi:hypothetical protein